MLKSRVLYALLALSTAILFCARLQSQATIEVIGRSEPIPVGFKTYSLFLICNPQWLDPAKSSGLTQLYYQFKAFGRSIGDDQAAVWFWRQPVGPSWETTFPAAAVIDVERSIRFCKAWSLKPSEGPFIVVTATRPDEAHLSRKLPNDSAVFKLGGMAPPAISSLISKLTDALLLSGKPVIQPALPPSSVTGQTPPAVEPSSTGDNALWVRMLSAVQQTINNFGCAWSFKLNAGPVSADLKSCKTPS
jgi:hypothetical protein